MSLQFVVGKDVDSLGVTFFSLPPGTPIINRVMPGSWAEAQKLRAEDELVCMNGSRVAEMTRHNFCKRIQERPLTLDVSRPSTKRSDETTQVGKSAISDGTVDVSVGQTLPVPSLAFCPGVAAMASDDNLEELHPCCSSAKDISTAQNSGEVSGKSVNSPRFNLIVGDGVESLGVAFLTLPPGKVVIHQVVAGSWAEAQKLQVADELVCVSGSRVAEMTLDDFCKRIQERPLMLDIYRPASECDKVTAASLAGSCAGTVSSPVICCGTSDDDDKESCLTETPEDMDSHETSSVADSSEVLFVPDDSSAGSTPCGADGVTVALASSEGVWPTAGINLCKSEGRDSTWDKDESISLGDPLGVEVNISHPFWASGIDELSSALEKFRSRHMIDQGH